jgi:hypothetical protein
MCGRGGFNRGCGGRGSRGGGSNAGGRGHGDLSYKAQNKFPPCQLCGRTNHLVFKCYKRFDTLILRSWEKRTTSTQQTPIV